MATQYNEERASSIDIALGGDPVLLQAPMFIR
jgi:hypothetical protein